MNNRSNMDIRLKIIEELYDDGGGRIRGERPDLTEEYEAFESVKSALDARPARRPDAAAVDAVLKAASDASAGRTPSVRQRVEDRAPQARRALYLRSAGIATAVLVVLVAVMTVWQTNVVELVPPEPQAENETGEVTSDKRQNGDRKDELESAPSVREESAPEFALAKPNGGAVDEMSDAPRSERTTARDLIASSAALERQDIAATRSFADFERELRTADPSFTPQTYRIGGVSRRPSDILPVGMRPMAAAAPVEEIERQELRWDQGGDVLEVFRQIEMIGDGFEQGWSPAVPLEMLQPARDARASGIQPAGSRRR